jgi:hypothetical protein
VALTQRAAPALDLAALVGAPAVEVRPLIIYEQLAELGAPGAVGR